MSKICSWVKTWESVADCMPSQYITKCTCRGTLPHTTGIAAFPQQRWSRYGFQGAYQTTDPNWDGPEKQSKPPVTSKPVVIHLVHIKVRLCELKVWHFSFCKFPHHPGAAFVDVVLQVTQAIVWHDDPCQPAIQGEVRRLVGHQEQQTLCLWSPTNSPLKDMQKEGNVQCYFWPLI